MNTPVIIQYWKPVFEILALWATIYHIMLFFEGTRALQVLRGIIVLLLVFFLVEKLNLQVLEWLLTKMFGISVIAILIIFHPEIRQGLARLGERHFLSTAPREEEIDRMLREIGVAAENLCRKKLGAIIAIEKNLPLSAYIESGVNIDAAVSSDLIEAIFTPNNPLHDGAAVIRRARLSAAGCLFPLTQNKDLSRIFGTRHRAALGLSEETDALVIVISEERQDISLVYRAKLYKDLSREELFLKIKELVRKENA
ncbi:MAG: TIGR00159 family protein [Candidatus Omnitrophica bacterium]|nr:TIGR00159 family protein [Candidatus Omnitrophota bacterium]